MSDPSLSQEDIPEDAKVLQDGTVITDDGVIGTVEGEGDMSDIEGFTEDK